MAVFIIIMSFWGVYSIFMTTDYQENKLWLEEEAPSKFTEDTKIKLKNTINISGTPYSILTLK